jgi:hypothetical protein
MSEEKKPETINAQGVGTNHDGNIVILGPKSVMTRDEALLHAAWIVALANFDTEFEFDDYLEAVMDT